MAVESIRFMPGDRIYTFTDKYGTEEQRVLYRTSTPTNQCIGFPAVQAKDSYTETYSSYIGNLVSYYVFIKIDGWDDFVYYKKFNATDTSKYVQHGSNYYYMVNMRDFMGSNMIRGVSYSFKAYAVYASTNEGTLSTRDNNGADITSLENAYRITNPMIPAISSCTVSNSILSILSFSPSYASTDAPHEFEDYEIVLMPDNGDSPTYENVTLHSSTIMGPRESRIFRRSSTCMPFNIPIIRSEDEIPSSGAYIRLDKLTELGVSGFKLGLRLIQTSSSSIYNEYCNPFGSEFISSLWYPITFDEQLKDGFSFYADYSKIVPGYHNLFTDLEEHFLFLGSVGDKDAYVDYSYALLFKPGEETFYVDISDIISYSGNVEFELKLSCFDYTFKSSTPRFEINVSQYLNYFVPNVYINAYVKAYYKENPIFFFEFKFRPATAYAPVKLILTEQMYHNEELKANILAVGKDGNDPVCSINVDFNSNFAVNYNLDDEEFIEVVLLNKYINAVCRLDIINTDTGTTHSNRNYSDYTTTGRDIVVYEIPLAVGTNNFSYTVTDTVLGITVSSGTLKYVYSDTVSGNTDRLPLLSIDKTNRVVCVNGFANDTEDYTLYVNGTLAVTGQIYCGQDDGPTFIGGSFTIGSSSDVYFNSNSFVIDTITTKINLSNNFPIRKTDFRMVSVYLFPERNGRIYEIFYKDGSRAKVMYSNDLYTIFYSVDKNGNEVEL